MTSVPYETRDFNFGNPWGVGNGSAQIDVSLPELLHAAITVGHPRWPVPPKGQRIAALAECLWKVSAVMMTVRGDGRHFYSTDRFEGLDPSEKQGAMYQLGQTVTKLFAQRLFGASHLLHLDVYRRHLDPQFQPGSRSRPDLVGLDLSDRWLVFESKGRSSKPTDGEIAKAKQQAQRVVSINNNPPALRAATIGYFHYLDSYASNRRLQAVIADPEGTSDCSPLRLQIPVEQLMQLYYAPLMPLFIEARGSDETGGVSYWYFEDLDLRFGIASELAALLRNGAYKDVWPWIKNNIRTLREKTEGGLAYDGVAILPGEKWIDMMEKSKE